MERLQHAAVAAREAARASREQLGCAKADAAAAKEGAKRAEAAHQQALARLAESKCADSQLFESIIKPVMVAPVNFNLELSMHRLLCRVAPQSLCRWSSSIDRWQGACSFPMH